MAEAGIQEVETYVDRRQNTVTPFISRRLVMNLYMAVVRSLGFVCL